MLLLSLIAYPLALVVLNKRLNLFDANLCGNRIYAEKWPQPKRKLNRAVRRTRPFRRGKITD